MDSDIESVEDEENLDIEAEQQFLAGLTRLQA